LSIFDATTSVPGIIHYGASNYVFIYAFSALMLHQLSRRHSERLDVRL
jgi:hypothetical protein